ncbi:Mitochondrial Rho GTPase [Plasmodiophora brassicae]|uniref:Mitochondrial Rho GTPase n=1 Tax=Plasmodiophora brassicae TaxID=37360 RepID=A0A0G4J6U1_PLABS|nr:hypothetical protein PBRA_003073 [Plasmodiophora brassicae]SPQ95552.1 unnamed protein product [Plasmodiophora brassicae]
MTKATVPATCTAVRTVVVGDAGCGKTSLCSTLVSEAFPTTVPRVLHPIIVPPDITPDKIRLTLVDTSSNPLDSDKTEREVKQCDVVVLVCAVDQADSLDRVTSFWLPRFAELAVDVPIVLAMNKIDLVDMHERSLFSKRFNPLVKDFKITICIECSAKVQIHVPEVFYSAQKAVTHPVQPLFDRATKSLTTPFIKALTRIFRHCDADMDGKLSSSELDSFQDQCFEVPLKQTDIAAIKRLLWQKDHSYVRDDGVTLDGFLYLQQVFIERGKTETPWRVLRHFGYDNALRIKSEYIDRLCGAHVQCTAEHHYELTDNGLRFLYNMFKQFDRDQDGVLSPAELEEIFFPYPGGPPFPEGYSDYVATDSTGSLTMFGWLSQFALLAFFDVRQALQTLTFIGYPAQSVSECAHLVKKGSASASLRNAIHCFVYGSTKCGKSAFLDRLLNKPVTSAHRHTRSLHTVCNMVDVPDIFEAGDESKFLIMTEVPADPAIVDDTAANEVPHCDLVLLMYDVSDPHSLAYAHNLIRNKLPYTVPHILLAFKSDKPAVEQIADDDETELSPAAICQTYDLVALASGAYRQDLNGLFRNLTEAALLPGGFLPSTPTQRRRRRIFLWAKRALVATVFTSAAVYVNVRFDLLGRVHKMATSLREPSKPGRTD